MTVNTTLSQPITINHNPIETVDDFTYLGSVKIQTTLLRKILTPDCPKPAQPLRDFDPSGSLKSTVRKQKYISTTAM